MKEQMIINAGTESKICGASKKRSLLFVLSLCVEAAGEELTGMEGVKWYIRLSLICTVLRGGLHVGNCLQSSAQSWKTAWKNNSIKSRCVAGIARTAELGMSLTDYPWTWSHTHVVVGTTVPLGWSAGTFHLLCSALHFNSLA